MGEKCIKQYTLGFRFWWELESTKNKIGIRIFSELFHFYKLNKVFTSNNILNKYFCRILHLKSFFHGF